MGKPQRPACEIMLDVILQELAKRVGHCRLSAKMARRMGRSRETGKWNAKHRTHASENALRQARGRRRLGPHTGIVRSDTSSSPPQSCRSSPARSRTSSSFCVCSIPTYVATYPGFAISPVRLWRRDLKIGTLDMAGLGRHNTDM